MAKKRILTIASTLIFIAPTVNTLNVEASSKTLEELTQQQTELNNQSKEINKKIEVKEQNLNSLAEEKRQLQIDVANLQQEINKLTEKINIQEEKITQLEENIIRLQKEIAYLQEQINQRDEQLALQARSVQTQMAPQDIIDVVISAESISELFGRIRIVTQLLSANQDALQIQQEDQQALEDTEVQLYDEQKELEKIRTQLEANQAQLVVQRNTVESKITQVAEQYDLTAEEKEAFIDEQILLAQQINVLKEETKVEQERIAEEARQKAEQERIAEKERQVAVEQQIVEEKKSLVKDSSPNNVKNKVTPSSSSISSSSASSKPVQNVVQEKASTSGWIMPARGRLTSPYGWRTHPIFGDQRFHNAVDIAGSGPIIAARSGKVVTASYSNGLGYFIKIDHGDGYQSVYGHMQPNLSVSVGQEVSQGQQIGIMGTTGNSTGVHLDFQILKNGKNVNPAPYIGL